MRPLLLIAALLFFACWLTSLLFAARWLADRDRQMDWRDTVVVGSVLGGVAILALTESLSAFTRFQRGWIIGAWLAVLAVAGIWLARRHRRSTPEAHSRMRGLLLIPRPSLAAIEIVMLLLIVLHVLLLAIVALAYPPNNYDSMAYHMSRIMHWEQQRSVGFYPTGIMMQTRGAPFAEFAIAHPLLVAGSDRFANLVQWYAMVLSAVTASLLAAEFGASRMRQIGAALLVVSIPMGILQATSTQNDYVVAAWLLVFVLYAVRFLRAPDRRQGTVMIGAALGLAIATKQTALAYAAPFCAVIAVAALMRGRVRALAVISGMVLCLNGPVFFRTTMLLASPLGSGEGLANETRSAAVATSNAIRNLSVHLPVDGRISLVRDLSHRLLSTLTQMNARTGIDPTDPRFSMTNTQDAFAIAFRMHEDMAGNFLHALLALAAGATCIVAVLLPWWRGGRPAARLDVIFVAGCLFAGYAFFSYYFKWQLWTSRLQLPLFVIAAPVIAVALLPGSRRLAAIGALAAGLTAPVWIVGNETRPLTAAMPWRAAEREPWYFANRPDLLPVFRDLTTAIVRTPCRAIGLRISSDPFEYPLWVLLRKAGAQATIRHLETHAPLNFDPAFMPCAVLATRPKIPEAGAETLQFGGFYVHMRGR